MRAERYKENPFLEGMVIPVKGRQVRLSSGSSEENVLVNQHTGEIKGTHVTTYKKVDGEQFIKLFTANIALTFDLSAQGIKAFSVLMWAMQNKAIERDEIFLDTHTREDFIDSHLDSDKPLSDEQHLTYSKRVMGLDLVELMQKLLVHQFQTILPN